MRWGRAMLEWLFPPKHDVVGIAYREERQRQIDDEEAFVRQQRAGIEARIRVQARISRQRQGD